MVKIGNFSQKHADSKNHFKTRAGPNPSEKFKNMDKYFRKDFLGVKLIEIIHGVLMDCKKPTGLILQSVTSVDCREV